MPHWSEKAVRYQAGVVIQLGGFLIYVIGYGSPAWTQLYSRYREGAIIEYRGLWQICGQRGTRDCITYEQLHSTPNTGIPPWHDAARALCTIALFIAFMSTILSVVFNFTKYARKVKEEVKTVRVLPTFAGIFGVLGSSIYALRTQVIVSPNNASLSWAFGLAILGSCMISISACLMTPNAGGRRSPSRTTGPQSMWTTNVPVDGPSSGYPYWQGAPGGPVMNHGFDDSVFMKPPDFENAPPSYDEAMRGSV